MTELQDIANDGNFYIDYGSVDLLGSVGISDNENDGNGPASSTEMKNPDGLKSDIETQANEGGKTDEISPGKSSSSSKFSNVMNQLDELGFSIPLLEDASNLANMLLGNDIDLFTWTMPQMGIESEFSKSFPYGVRFLETWQVVLVLM